MLDDMVTGDETPRRVAGGKTYVPPPMDGPTFGRLLKGVKGTNVKFARILKADPRTIARWRSSGPPHAVAVLVELLYANSGTLADLVKDINQLRQFEGREEIVGWDAPAPQKKKPAPPPSPSSD